MCCRHSVVQAACDTRSRQVTAGQQTPRHIPRRTQGHTTLHSGGNSALPDTGRRLRQQAQCCPAVSVSRLSAAQPSPSAGSVLPSRLRQQAHCCSAVSVSRLSAAQPSPSAGSLLLSRLRQQAQCCPAVSVSRLTAAHCSARGSGHLPGHREQRLSSLVSVRSPAWRDGGERVPSSQLRAAPAADVGHSELGTFSAAGRTDCPRQEPHWEAGFTLRCRAVTPLPPLPPPATQLHCCMDQRRALF